MGKGALGAALAGALSGYMRGTMYNDEKAKADAAEQRRQDDHNLRMKEAQREEQARVSLADAARPTSIEEGAGGMIRPPTMDDRDVGLPENASLANAGLNAGGFRAAGQTFSDRGQAERAAAAYNSEEATDKRVAASLATSGDVKGARAYRTSAAQARASAQELADKMWQRQLGDAIRGGHSGLAELVSRSQGDGMRDLKVEAVASPDGKSVVYAKVNPDGSKTPLPHLTFSNDRDGAIRAAYMLDTTVKPEQRYSHMLSEEKTRAAATTKLQELQLKERELTEVKIPTAEAKAALAEVRAQIAQARAAGGSDKIGREERIRYTALLDDARRAQDKAQDTLRALQKDPVFMMNSRKQGTPEAQQVEELTAAARRASEDRDLFRGLLADSGAGKKPALKDAKPEGPKVAEPKSQADYDALPKGARYLRDGTVYTKK